MAKVVVIGGGFAGLSAAVYLTKNGHSLRLFEASPKLGGRAYSFYYEKEKTIVDNGQHILMGCYLFTLEFLETIKALDTIKIQPNLKINFASRKSTKYKLDTGEVTYPFNILAALKDYQALSNSDKISITKLFLKIAVCNPKHHSDKTTKEFLEENNQSKNAIKSLWEIMHVGTMNCKMEESSAEIFIRVLKQIFFTVNDSTKIILPKVGLSEIYCEQSKKYLEEKSGEIFLSEKLVSIDFNEEEQTVTKIRTSKKVYNDFDYVVLAIPPYQLQNVLPQSIKYSFPEYKYSSILNVHLWVNENIFNEDFYGLIDSKIHWLFNQKDHLTLITSAADELIDLSDDEIMEIVREELPKYFGEFKSSMIRSHLIIKEKRATFKPTVSNTKARKNIQTNINNLFFAGDWTNTGYPSTIEGAVKSGVIISDKLSDIVEKNSLSKN